MKRSFSTAFWEPTLKPQNDLSIKESVEQQSKVLNEGQRVCREGILKVLREGEPNWDDLIFGPQ